MGQWHRDNPELCGTSADPWMEHAGHRAAYEELHRAGLIYTEPDELEDDSDGPGSTEACEGGEHGSSAA